MLKKTGYLIVLISLLIWAASTYVPGLFSSQQKQDTSCKIVQGAVYECHDKWGMEKVDFYPVLFTDPLILQRVTYCEEKGGEIVQIMTWDVQFPEWEERFRETVEEMKNKRGDDNK